MTTHSQPDTDAEWAKKYAAQWQQVRAGLMQPDDYIRDNESQIRAERQARCLENR